MSVELQGSLFTDAEASFGQLGSSVTRRMLSRGAWVDVRPGWASQVDLFDRLVDGVDWRAERRQMYDRVVDVPRLVRFYSSGERWPDPALVDAKSALELIKIIKDSGLVRLPLECPYMSA